MIDPAELVGTAEIAERAGVTSAAVSNWARRFTDTFPEPVVRLTAGPVYLWPEVEEWIADRAARQIESRQRRIAKLQEQIDRLRSEVGE